MTQSALSKHQIIALAAVFGICVSTLLLLAPGSQLDDTTQAGVARSETPAALTTGSVNLSSADLRKIGASDDPSGATRQVYALDRPSSGVLVTLGTAHLDAASVSGTTKVAPPPSAPKFVAAPTPAPEPTPAPSIVVEPVLADPLVQEPVQIATPAPKPARAEELVTATAPVFESDEELIDTAILFGEMTSSSNSEPRVYTVVAGDSLASIAQRFYGTPDAAIRIFEANRATLRAPESILVGQALLLP
ncbi:LysM peptidoglycan-binding domain-containing protein [Cognatishimia sp. MH4019]|uniref:LysM peptidoglycan-binding domain-containing protein n=1 Tax=Cognatishimia sp. MH4019 TaxID=2854030 RepID=UPI001CD39847|nr:LysM peptidoglycan-binding domain-containing protein [Cognatishimia sp. MH4019]